MRQMGVPRGSEARAGVCAGPRLRGLSAPWPPLRQVRAPGQSLPRGRSLQHPAALGAQLITLCCRPSSCWARLPWSCPLRRRGDRGTRRCELAKRGIWKGGPGGRGGLGLPGFRPMPGASSRLEPPLLPPGAPRGVHTHKGGAPGSGHPVTQQRKLVRPRAGPLGNPLPPSRPPGCGAGLGLF